MSGSSSLPSLRFAESTCGFRAVPITNHFSLLTSKPLAPRKSTASNCRLYQAVRINELTIIRPVSKKKGRLRTGCSGGAVAATRKKATSSTTPSATLPDKGGLALPITGRPRSRTATVAARFIQTPDQASAPNASDARCQPANRTPVANIELNAPATGPNQDRQRAGETIKRARRNEVAIVACPLG